MSETSGAVFLSYASQDVDAAQRLCDALRAAGAEVWFDRSELRGGDAWDASIRRQIKECALFVPLISANTNARSEGYFRLEWKLAVDRSHQMADEQAFVVPVVVDDTPEAAALVPDRFRERQWTRLLGGEATPEWVERVQRLLAEPVAAKAPATGGPTTVARRRRRWLPALAALAAVVAIAGVAFVVWKDRAASEATATDRRSIAVLPFENLSGRQEDAYLADGLQEEILTAVARIRELKVISRTSVAEYRGKAHNVREIGQRLGAGTVLEGSIRRDGNTLRLTVQLIDAKQDRHLFAVSYDRELGHLLDLQSAVAKQVADSLSVTLTRYERGELDRVGTSSGDAYDRYLRAVAVLQRVFFEAEDLDQPKRLLEEALKLDSKYADAFARLSIVMTRTYWGETRRPEHAAAARQAYERALAIEPQLPEALFARGLYATYVSDDPDRAIPDLEAVVRARPSSAEAHEWLGFALRRRGRMDEALAHLSRAWELDPLNGDYFAGPWQTLRALRRWPEAAELADLRRRRFPDDPMARIFRARAESEMRHTIEPLRALLQEPGGVLAPKPRSLVEAEVAVAEGRYLDAVPPIPAIWEDSFDRSLWEGMLRWAAGDPNGAERCFRDVQREVQEKLRTHPEWVATDTLMGPLALAQSMLGEHAAALATIDKVRALTPESQDATNGPPLSFLRSILLVRAGRGDEGYAEVARLLRVPFGAPGSLPVLGSNPALLAVKDDPRYDELIKRPPRL